MSEIPLSADAVQGSLLLIVDDVPTNLNVLGDLLRDAGYRIKAATSGPVALRYAAMEPRPALILLDVMMPEMNGYEVLTRLKQDPATRDIPVIFLTALDNAQDEERVSSMEPLTTSPSRSSPMWCWPGCAASCWPASR